MEGVSRPRLMQRLAPMALVCLAACTPEAHAPYELMMSGPQLEFPRAISPLPESLPLDARRVRLGQALFHDERLSRDQSISCASCHDLRRGGADYGQRYSTGIDGATTRVNTPTVLNSGLNFAQFWDGRAATLEEQIAETLQSPIEMDADLHVLAQRVAADEGLAGQFARAYADGVSVDNVIDALATYVRALITPGSPFDRHLSGERDALSYDQLEGYRLFSRFGCLSCHQGRNVGGNLFQRFGVMGDYFADRGDTDEVDLGRYNVTGREQDRFVFKVPTLRNVAERPPYFHDGSAETLEEAVQIMVRYQLGRPVTERELALLVAFLRSLSGELDESLLQ